jgi:hypothetical protein
VGQDFYPAADLQSAFFASAGDAGSHPGLQALATGGGLPGKRAALFSEI